MEEEAEPAEKINELLGAVAALKAYIAHLPGAADVDLEAVRRRQRLIQAKVRSTIHLFGSTTNRCRSQRRTI